MNASLARRSLLLVAASAAALGFGGLALLPVSTASADHHMAAGGVESAVAAVRPTKGHKVRGTIRFTPIDGGLHVKGKINNLEPGSTHGFHIHEYGDITENDGTGCGGHFNPGGHEHALPSEPGAKHAGDMGNITADDSGTAEVDLTVEGVSLTGAEDGILGRGLIVHADPDDGSQPSGNAGDRIAMAVIGVDGPKDSRAGGGDKGEGKAKGKGKGKKKDADDGGGGMDDEMME